MWSCKWQLHRRYWVTHGPRLWQNASPEVIIVLPYGLELMTVPKQVLCHHSEAFEKAITNNNAPSKVRIDPLRWPISKDLFMPRLLAVYLIMTPMNMGDTTFTWLCDSLFANGCLYSELLRLTCSSGNEKPYLPKRIWDNSPELHQNDQPVLHKVYVTHLF